MKKCLFLSLPLLLAVLACTGNPDRFEQAGRQPDIYPDYIGVTVPATIAPLDFDIDGAEKVIAVAEGPDGQTVKAAGKSANFPVKAWHKLLAASKGGTVRVTACGKFDGKWKRFEPFELYVSEDAIDYGIAYRLIAPGYQSFSHIGIYERDLSSFDEVCLIGGKNFDGCVNCHAFNRTRPEFFSLHVRGERGATFIMKDGKTAAYDMKTDSTLAACVYPSWHPDGRFIAYSTNVNRQGFYQRHDKVLEVYDLKSDLQVYDTEKNVLITSPEVKVDGVNENMPAFSADGRAIYFASCTEQEIPRSVTEIRYNLCRVDFNPETGDIGHQVDTLVFAEAMGKSVSFPKPSYDGRWIMYQLADYGCFGAWH
ncbi:MAG: PD40 domain-containing protein, partial [Bacteroidales bacterium]|nr:PD40 domain-containing protein [Bacteroidales bacterium]